MNYNKVRSNKSVISQYYNVENNVFDEDGSLSAFIVANEC